MIKKISDISVLSGVQSPLLPLIYGDYYYHYNENDGAYVQIIDGKITAAFSLRNNCIDAVKISDNIDFSEFESFFLFSKATNVTSDFSFNIKSEKKYSLLKMKPKLFTQHSGIVMLSTESKLQDYEIVYSLISENKGGNFPEWFVFFSGKVNKDNARGVYLNINNESVSSAVAPCIFNNKGVIAGVITKDESRNKGYGSKCIEALLNELYSMGIEEVYLWCADEKVAFYEKIGFKKDGHIYIREGF